MHILRFQVARTKHLLTSRSGLVCLEELMERTGVRQLVDQHFPSPMSNRGFLASDFVRCMMLSLHEGGTCLDDVQHIRDDVGLRKLLNLNAVPGPECMGKWLRRMGYKGVEALVEVNRALLKMTLGGCKAVTLDIDATFCKSDHQEAEWSYLKQKGYIPHSNNIFLGGTKHKGTPIGRVVKQ